MWKTKWEARRRYERGLRLIRPRIGHAIFKEKMRAWEAMKLLHRQHRHYTRAFTRLRYVLDAWTGSSKGVSLSKMKLKWQRSIRLKAGLRAAKRAVGHSLHQQQGRAFACLESGFRRQSAFLRGLARLRNILMTRTKNRAGVSLTQWRRDWEANVTRETAVKRIRVCVGHWLHRREGLVFGSLVAVWQRHRRSVAGLNRLRNMIHFWTGNKRGLVVAAMRDGLQQSRLYHAGFARLRNMMHVWEGNERGQAVYALKVKFARHLQYKRGATRLRNLVMVWLGNEKGIHLTALKLRWEAAKRAAGEKEERCRRLEAGMSRMRLIVGHYIHALESRVVIALQRGLHQHSLSLVEAFQRQRIFEVAFERCRLILMRWTGNRVGERVWNWRVKNVEEVGRESKGLKARMLSLSGPTKTTGTQASQETHPIGIQCDDWAIQTVEERQVDVVCKYLGIMFQDRYRFGFVAWAQEARRVVRGRIGLKLMRSVVGQWSRQPEARALQRMRLRHQAHHCDLRARELRERMSGTLRAQAMGVLLLWQVKGEPKAWLAQAWSVWRGVILTAHRQYVDDHAEGHALVQEELEALHRTHAGRADQFEKLANQMEMEVSLLRSQADAMQGELDLVNAQVIEADENSDEESRNLRTRLVEMCGERNGAMAAAQEAQLAIEKMERAAAKRAEASDGETDRLQVQLEAISSIAEELHLEKQELLEQLPAGDARVIEGYEAEAAKLRSRLDQSEAREEALGCLVEALEGENSRMHGMLSQHSPNPMPMPPPLPPLGPHTGGLRPSPPQGVPQGSPPPRPWESYLPPPPSGSRGMAPMPLNHVGMHMGGMYRGSPHSGHAAEFPDRRTEVEYAKQQLENLIRSKQSAGSPLPSGGMRSSPAQLSFDQIDRNHDGVITREEWQQVGLPVKAKQGYSSPAGLSKGLQILANQF